MALVQFRTSASIKYERSAGLALALSNSLFIDDNSQSCQCHARQFSSILVFCTYLHVVTSLLILQGRYAQVNSQLELHICNVNRTVATLAAPGHCLLSGPPTPLTVARPGDLNNVTLSMFGMSS